MKKTVRDKLRKAWKFSYNRQVTVNLTQIWICSQNSVDSSVQNFTKSSQNFWFCYIRTKKEKVESTVEQIPEDDKNGFVSIFLRSTQNSKKICTQMVRIQIWFEAHTSGIRANWGDANSGLAVEISELSAKINLVALPLRNPELIL